MYVFHIELRLKLLVKSLDSMKQKHNWIPIPTIWKEEVLWQRCIKSERKRLREAERDVNCSACRVKLSCITAHGPVTPHHSSTLGNTLKATHCSCQPDLLVTFTEYTNPKLTELNYFRMLLLYFCVTFSYLYGNQNIQVWNYIKRNLKLHIVI